MAGDYWIKLYHEMLDDPKTATLSDRLWRRLVELFLIAGRSGKSGELPDTAQLAWILRMDAGELAAELEKLAAAGFVQAEEGGWFVTNFEKRQAPASSTDRVRQFREREKKRQYYEGETKDETGDVAEVETDTKQIVSQKERKKETESDTERKTEGAYAPENIWRDVELSITGDPHFPQQTAKRLAKCRAIAIQDRVMVVQSPDANWMDGHMTSTIERALPGITLHCEKVRFVEV